MNPNSLLVQWSEGFFVVDDASAIAAAGGLVRQQLFTVSDVTNQDTATTMAEQELARLQEGNAIVAEGIVGIGGANDPYSGWTVGDSIPVSGWNAGTESLEVVGMTVNEDDEGNPTVVPELRSLVESRAERNEVQLKRAAPGLTSEVAAVARDDKLRYQTGKLNLEELSWGYDGQLRDKSSVMRYRRRCRITFLDVTLTVPGSTATALQVLVNGSPLTMDQNNVQGNTSLLIPAGVYHAVGLIPNVVVTEFDGIEFDVTTAGTGAETMSCQLLGAVSEV